MRKKISGEGGKGQKNGKDKEEGKEEKKKAPVSKGKIKGIKTVVASSDCESDAGEWYIIYCCGAYGNSRGREEWVQC